MLCINDIVVPFTFLFDLIFTNSLLILILFLLYNYQVCSLFTLIVIISDHTLIFKKM